MVIEERNKNEMETEIFDEELEELSNLSQLSELSVTSEIELLEC